MSFLSKMLGLDYHAPAKDPRYDKLIQQLEDPTFGQQSVQDSTRASVNNALPGFLQDMQGLKEENIKRGASTGDLGLSFEHDLINQFQNNIANAAAGQSASMFNNRTNLLFGGLNNDLDREQSAQNDASQRRGGFIGGLLDFGGGFLGSRRGKGGY